MNLTLQRTQVNSIRYSFGKVRDVSHRRVCRPREWRLFWWNGDLQGVRVRGGAPAAERAGGAQVRAAARALVPRGGARARRGGSGARLGDGLRGDQGGMQAADRPAGPLLPERDRRAG